MASTNGKKGRKKKTPSPFSANCLKKEIRPAPPQNKIIQISGKIKTKKKKIPAKIDVDAAEEEVERGEKLSEVYPLITPRFLAREIEALIAEEVGGGGEEDENRASALTGIPMLVQGNENEKVEEKEEREFKNRGRSRVEFMEAEGKDADRDRRGLRRSKR